MPWKNKRVLVTGAGGFIGSHLTGGLAARGARVRAFVRYNSKSSVGLLDLLSPALSDRIEIFPGDLRSPESVRRAVTDVEVVFHLGALISIPYSYVHPREVVEANVLGTLNVLTACRDLRVGRVLHTSSSEVYGTALYTPIDEKHPMQGQSPYSASKIGADMLAESFVRSYDLPVTTVRPFNTYGPRQSARAVIPTIITQALAGDRILLGDANPSRDLVYVEDTVDAFIRLAQAPEAVGEVVNVGTGQETTVEELVHTVGRLVGKELAIIFDATRIRPQKSEVMRLVADATKARRFGWAPSVTVEEGLRRTVQWIGEFRALYRTGTYEI
jgi:NAD dependent epimerase/dehydratase